jgi:hypothetical protein
MASTNRMIPKLEQVRLVALGALLPALAGCSHPELVVMARDPAAAAAHTKQIGTASAYALDDGALGPAENAGGFSGPTPSNAAQSGDGPLGDRVFRVDTHGFLEGCRYVAHGRICNLATLPDGKTAIGGALTWLIPGGAPATPGAGAWVAQGIRIGAAKPDDPAPIAPAPGPSFVSGQWFHCRFEAEGPRCLPVPEIDGPAMGTIGIAAFSLSDAGKQKDVIWLASAELTLVPLIAGGPFTSLQFHELRRCETSDDLDRVICNTVKMP